MNKGKNKNKTENKNLTIQIRGEICPDGTHDWYYGYMDIPYTNANQVLRVLEAHDGKGDLKLEINSQGGNLNAAITIFNTIKSKYKDKNIEVEVMGHAYSAAAILMAVGDKVTIPSNAMILIHDPLLMLDGAVNLKASEEVSETLRVAKESMLNTLLHKVKISKEELSALSSRDLPITAEECVRIGLADEISNPVPTKINKDSEGKIKNLVVNNIKYDLVSAIKPTLEKFYNEIEYENKEEDLMTPDQIKKLYSFKNLTEEMINRAIEQNMTVEQMEKEFGEKTPGEPKQEVLNETPTAQIVDEKQRMKDILALSDTIDRELVNQAIDEGWAVEKLSFVALKEGKMINKNTFAEHQKATIQNEINANEPVVEPTEDEKMANFINSFRFTNYTEEDELKNLMNLVI